MERVVTYRWGSLTISKDGKTATYIEVLTGTKWALKDNGKLVYASADQANKLNTLKQECMRSQTYTTVK